MRADLPSGGIAAWLGDQLSNRYFLVTLVIFIAIGVPAYFYLVGAMRQQFVSNYTAFSVSTAAAVFESHLESVPGGAFTEPLTGAELDTFLREVEQEVQERHLLKLKVWRPDGMLLYATGGGGVGETRPDGDHLLQKVSAGPDSEIEEDEAEVAGEKTSGHVLEIYLPIRGPEGTLANVFELYYSLAPLNSDLAQMRFTLMLFVSTLFVAVVGVGQLGGRLLVKRNRQLRAFSEEMTRLAVTDALTGVSNRRRFHSCLEDSLASADHDERPLSLVMVDLDFFKRVNDIYGHQTGDIVLRETAMALAGAARPVDLVARYGGEEFAILMPGAGEVEAAAVAGRLQSVIHGIAVAAGDERIPVSASFGVACFPAAGRDAESLISAADSALYFAKQTGRDRVCTFSTISRGSPQTADLDALLNRLRHAGLFTIQALAAAVDALGSDGSPSPRAPGSVGLARRAAAALRLSEEETELLELAASVYDIGKISVPDEVLAKTDSLSAEEAEVIKGHPETSARILAAVGGLERVLTIVRHHHEHVDGTGYPEGLRGEAIPYLARVLHVIDAFVEMTTDRPPQAAMTQAEAVSRLRADAGSRFDPAIVEALVESVFGEETATPEHSGEQGREAA